MPVIVAVFLREQARYTILHIFTEFSSVPSPGIDVVHTFVIENKTIIVFDTERVRDVDLSFTRSLLEHADVVVLSLTPPIALEVFPLGSRFACGRNFA